MGVLDGEVMALDLAGAEYDTKPELQALGVRFSDADSPFASTLYGAVVGSWTHAAGELGAGGGARLSG